MSVHPDAVVPPGRTDGAESSGVQADATRRGTVVVEDRVLRRIAGQVVSELGAVYGSSGGVLGVGAHADGSARPKVRVDRVGAGVEVRVEVGVAYPTSIRRAAAEIRTAVRDGVSELTGVVVRRVDIEVAFLELTDGTSDRLQQPVTERRARLRRRLA